MDIGVPYSVTQRGFYGRSINPKTAFDQGVLEATGGRGFTRDAVGDVKRTYEQKLANYLKQLPGDPDFSGIPQKYRNTLSSYLTNLKAEYVNEASVLDQLMVGSEDYMNAVSKMNQVKAAMENLDSQFKLYGENKKAVIEDIEGQTISLYGENQENVNLLRAIYNEEYDIRIDETGGIHFIGEDGEIALNKLPDYGIKDYETAQAMMKLGSDVYRNSYKNGIALTPDDIMYHQYKNQLKMAIDKGGKNSLMSILYDGLVGDVVMANDPSMQQAIQGYKNGEMSFSTLRDITVDNYMKVLINQSKIAISKRKVNPSSSGGNKDVSFKKDQASYNYYKKYLDANKVPPLPAGFQVRPETDASGNELDEPTGKMEIVGPKGTLLFDPNEGLDPNLFYQFMGLDHRVWAGGIEVDDVNTEFSE
jgi:hypothetical protein